MAASLFVSLLAASSLFQSVAVADLKTLSLDFEVRRHDSEAPRSLLRDAVSGIISNDRLDYLANISVGKPPQPLTVVLDTGSSALWVPAATSEMCLDFSDICRQSGSYDAGKSSTSKKLQDLFSIRYADGSGVNGTFITDTFGFGGITMENVYMAIALVGNKVNSENAVGVWGIGSEHPEAGIFRFDASDHRSIVSEMKRNGHIHTEAYSLWLGTIDESLGQIVFGGVDASKYTGPLDLFPIVDAPVPGTDLKRLTVQVTSMTWYQDDNFTEFLPENTVFRTLLDTGSTFSHFPQPVLDHLYLTAGVEFLEAGSKIPYVDCSLGSTKATVLFRFGGLQGITINVPISEMVLPFAGDFFSNKRSACQLGVGLSSPLGFVLGDTFLRSVYMVVDLENKYIGLAQAATDVDITKDSGGVTEITQGPSGIPGVGRIAPVLPWPSEYIKEWEAYRRPSNHTDGATTTRSSFAMLPTPVSPDVSSVSSSPGRNPFPPITAARSATSSYVFLDG